MTDDFYIHIHNFLNGNGKVAYSNQGIQYSSMPTGKELFAAVTEDFDLSEEKRYCLVPSDTEPTNVYEANIAYSDSTLSLEKDQHFSLIDEPEPPTNIVEVFFCDSKKEFPLSYETSFKMDSKIKTSQVRSHMFHLLNDPSSPVDSILFGIRTKEEEEKEWAPSGDLFLSGIDLNLLENNDIVFIVHRNETTFPEKMIKEEEEQEEEKEEAEHSTSAPAEIVQQPEKDSLHDKKGEEEGDHSALPLVELDQPEKEKEEEPQLLDLKVVCLFQQQTHPLISTINVNEKETTFFSLQTKLCETYFPERRFVNIFMYSFNSKYSADINEFLLTPNNFERSSWRNGIFLMPRFKPSEESLPKRRLEHEIALKSLAFSIKIDDNSLLCHYIFQVALFIQQFPDNFSLSVYKQPTVHDHFLLFDPTQKCCQFETTATSFLKQKNISLLSLDITEVTFVLQLLDPSISIKIAKNATDWATVGKIFLEAFSSKKSDNSSSKRKREEKADRKDKKRKRF